MSGVEKALAARARYESTGKMRDTRPDFAAKLMVYVYPSTIWIAVIGGEGADDQSSVRYRRTIKRPPGKPVHEIVTRMFETLQDEVGHLYEDQPSAGEDFDW